MSGRRECPVCGALLVAPAMFCDADWLAVPRENQQEIGERYADARVAQASRSSTAYRDAIAKLNEALTRASSVVRALLGG